MPILLSLLFASSAYLFKRQRRLERKVKHYMNILEADLDEYSEKISNMAKTIVLLKDMTEVADAKGNFLLEDLEKSRKVFEFMPKKKTENEIN